MRQWAVGSSAGDALTGEAVFSELRLQLSSLAPDLPVEVVPDGVVIGEDRPGVFMHRKLSERAFGSIASVHLSFIDGDHSLEGITGDLLGMAPRTRCVLAGHDYAMSRFPGIPIALSRFLGSRVAPRFHGQTLYLDSDFVWWVRSPVPWHAAHSVGRDWPRLATGPRRPRGAMAVPSSGPPAPPGCELRSVPNKGLGLFALGSHGAGVQVFTDEPVFGIQHTGNRRVVAACANCCAFIGSLQAQLETLFGEARFAPLMGSIGGLVQHWDATLQQAGAAAGWSCGPGARCLQGCGELYCSEACRDAHFRHSHNLLCTGPVKSQEHPLVRFKVHAIEHADTLLLAAHVLAHLINRAKAAGGGAERTKALMAELLGFCHAPFVQACRAPPGGVKDHDFMLHTRGLVTEAAALLQQALAEHAPEEANVLFESGPWFFSEVLGMFEYNNIDVEVPSPVGQLFVARGSQLAAAGPGNPQAVAELEVLDRLLREKEWVMKCVWGEETTGIFGDDVEDTAAGCAPNIAMGIDVANMDEEAADAAVAGAAMAQARAEVNGLTLEQLLSAPWPALHGTALFASVARLNHSCVPNLKIVFPRNSASLSAVSLTPINPGDELCISYIMEDADVKIRRRRLLEYGFTCDCPRCLQEDSLASRRNQKRLK
ncbi:unnamed protein product, partial [Prorocentrum cordatum]